MIEAEAEAVTVTGLTKDDIKAMRQCDHIAIQHSNGKGDLRCIKKLEKRGPFDDDEREHSISVDSYVTAYSMTEDSSEYRDTARCTCFELVYNYEYSANPWQALCLIVKPGDDLRLKWIADNMNGNLRDANARLPEQLHRDELSIEVRRGGKAICAVFLRSSLCPDNSARMIRGILTPARKE